jgi:hypothetical protein
MITLIVAIAVVIVPAIDARPKDKDRGNKDAVVTEEVAPEEAATTEVVAQDSTLNSDEPTLLDLDADGDYIPDAMDNCPGAQNPDQADSDGDGAGDACPIYEDFDGDGVADKEDNCPNIATSDFADRDGDGIGDPCDKSPDGVEPEPDWPEYGGEEGAETMEAPPVESGAGEEGRTFERSGSEKSRERSRTTKEAATITTGEDTTPAEEEWVDETWEGEGGEGEVITEGPNAVPYEPSGRDNPRRNEELLAEAAASGELYAEPLPPPEPQRAWDEEVTGVAEWQTLMRIDAGVVERGEPADNRQAASGDEETADSGKDRTRKRDQSRGWMGAPLLIQDDLGLTDLEEPADELDGEPPSERPGASEETAAVAPVPIENGLQASGDIPIAEPAVEQDSTERGDRSDRNRSSESRAGRQIEANGEDHEAGDEAAPLVVDAATTARNSNNASDAKDGSRRNGSSRAVAAETTSQRSRQSRDRSDNELADAGRSGGENNKTRGNNANSKKRDRQKARQERSESRDQGSRQGWAADEYFDGGVVLHVGDAGPIAGTDEEQIYLTQRAGSGTGKRRGFTYAIPVDRDGPYRVRLYFAEAEFDSEGSRVFSISAEGEALVDDLDVYSEAGAMTALVKQADVQVSDGELNLLFNASSGAPIVAGIEVLQPAD